MQNLRTTINNRFDKLDGQWRAMPVKKQHRYTLLLFAAPQEQQPGTFQEN